MWRCLLVLLSYCGLIWATGCASDKEVGSKGVNETDVSNLVEAEDINTPDPVYAELDLQLKQVKGEVQEFKGSPTFQELPVEVKAYSDLMENSIDYYQKMNSLYQQRPTYYRKKKLDSIRTVINSLQMKIKPFMP